MRLPACSISFITFGGLQWRCKPPIKREKEREACVEEHKRCARCYMQHDRQEELTANKWEEKREKTGYLGGWGLGGFDRRQNKRSNSIERRWRRKKSKRNHRCKGWGEACVAIGASKADVSISFGLRLTLKRETLKLLHRRLLPLWSPSDHTPPNGTATKTGAPTSPRGIPCKPAQNHSPTMERWLTARKKCVNILAALVPRAEGERQV